MFQENFGALCTRLNLDRAIIDFNLSHLKDNIDTFMSKYRAYARSYLIDNGRNLQPEHLMLPNKNEMCLALEFFLAMDGEIHRRSLSIEDDVVFSGCVLHEVVRVSWRSATSLDKPFILRRRRTTFDRLQPAAVRSSFMRECITRASEIFGCWSLTSFRQRLRSASQLPSGKNRAWLLLVSAICSERCRPVPHRMSSMLSHAFAKNSTMLARLLWTSTKPCWVSCSLSPSLVNRVVDV